MQWASPRAWTPGARPTRTWDGAARPAVDDAAQPGRDAPVVRLTPSIA